MEDARKQLVEAITGRADDSTLQKLARVLAPRNPSEQVVALLELEDELTPQYADLKAQAAKLARELAVLDTIKQRVDATITGIMVLRKLTKVDTGYATVSLVQGRESMVVTDLDAVPDDLATMKKTANKRAAKAYIEQSGGLVPPGFDIVRGDPFITRHAKKRVG